MHLLLVCVSATTSPSGVCRHTANIALGMLCNPSMRVTILIGEWQADYFREAFGLPAERLEIVPVRIANSPLARNLWHLRDLPVVARTLGADVVHLTFPVPILRTFYSVPVILSLHDLYPFDIPENFGKQRAWLNRAALRLCLRGVDAIACVSEETRTRVHEVFPALSFGKTNVIPNSIYLHREVPDEPAPATIGNHPFLLCVAQHRANKNIPLLLRSFRVAIDRGDLVAQTKLVIVGNEGPETPRVQRVIAESGLTDRVIFLSGIPDTFLSSLYANCELVVSPSLIEGFGLPVAEALSAGCRVVCSDIAAFRAIGAERCVFFNPLDASGESLVSALRIASRTPRISEEFFTGFDPQKASAMYLDLYATRLCRNCTNPFQPSTADLTASGDL